MYVIKINQIGQCGVLWCCVAAPQLLCCVVLCCVAVLCRGWCVPPSQSNNTWIFQIHIQQDKMLYVWLDADYNMKIVLQDMDLKNPVMFMTRD